MTLVETFYAMPFLFIDVALVSHVSLVILFLSRICYLPHQLLKKHGIPGPTPSFFYGHYDKIAKLVSFKTECIKIIVLFAEFSLHVHRKVSFTHSTYYCCIILWTLKNAKMYISASSIHFMTSIWTSLTRNQLILNKSYILDDLRLFAYCKVTLRPVMCAGVYEVFGALT